MSDLPIETSSFDEKGVFDFVDILNHYKLSFSYLKMY